MIDKLEQVELRFEKVNELICLSNMENINSVLIDEGVPQSERLFKLNKIAIQQMIILEIFKNIFY